MDDKTIEYYARWEKRFEHLKKKANKILELGCYKGQTSKWFADTLLNNKNSKLFCVDTWKGSVEYNEDFKANEKEFKKNIKNSKFPDKVIVHKKTSFNFFMNFFMENKKPYFNLIYIDACHDGRCVLSDAILSFKSLKLDGYIVFDDYGWKKTEHDYERPKIAVDAFLNIFRENIEVTHRGYKIVIKKISEYEF